MIAIVAKIGEGTFENPYRPDTTAEKWSIIEERKTEYVIEIFH